MAALAIGAYFLAMLVLAAKRPRLGLLAIVFFTPWNGFNIDLGLNVSIYQLTIAAVLLTTFARSLQPGWRPQTVPAWRLLAVFAGVAVIGSLVQLAFVPEVRIVESALRQPLTRAMIQIAVFLFTISPALLLAWSMRTVDDVKAMLATYLASVLVLAVIGWIQLAIWYATDTNPLPVGFLNTLLGGLVDNVREGAFGFELLDIRRMNSFAGEPRHLGGACVVAMLMIQAVLLTTRHVDARRLGALWFFLFLTTLGTYSTSAVALWIAGTLVVLVTPRVFGIAVQRSFRQIAAALLLIAAPVALGIAVAEARGVPVIALIADRTVERIESSGAVEDFDLAIIDFLKANPEALAFGTGIGNAHLYAGAYLATEFRWYAEDKIFTAKPMYLRLTSEVGVIGLLLFIGWYAVLVIDTARALRRPAGEGVVAIVPIATMTLAIFLATATIVPEFWAVAGALGAMVNAMRALPAPVALPGPVVPAPRRSGLALARDRSRRLAQKLGGAPLTP